MKNVLPICLTIFLGCASTPKESAEIFIVPDDAKFHANAEEQHLVKAPYYLPLNFIIDRYEHVYFYQLEPKPLDCIVKMGIDLPPDFINLQPNGIIEIPIEDIVQFIKLNIQYTDISERAISIASTADTLSSTEISKLFAYLTDPVNKLKFGFRHTTQEETVALDYKKRGEYYTVNKVSWDSTQTLFPPKILPTVKIFPPK